MMAYERNLDAEKRQVGEIIESLRAEWYKAIDAGASVSADIQEHHCRVGGERSLWRYLPTGEQTLTVTIDRPITHAAGAGNETSP